MKYKGYDIELDNRFYLGISKKTKTTELRQFATRVESDLQIFWFDNFTHAIGFIRTCNNQMH